MGTQHRPCTKALCKHYRAAGCPGQPHHLPTLSTAPAGNQSLPFASIIFFSFLKRSLFKASLSSRTRFVLFFLYRNRNGKQNFCWKHPSWALSPQDHADTAKINQQNPRSRSAPSCLSQPGVSRSCAYCKCRPYGGTAIGKMAIGNDHQTVVQPRQLLLCSPASIARMVMLCHPAVSRSRTFPVTMAPVLASMSKILSVSVLRSMAYLGAGKRGKCEKRDVPNGALAPCLEAGLEGKPNPTTAIRCSRNTNNHRRRRDRN